MCCHAHAYSLHSFVMDIFLRKTYRNVNDVYIAYGSKARYIHMYRRRSVVAAMVGWGGEKTSLIYTVEVC